jgi:hypothetical protein
MECSPNEEADSNPKEIRISIDAKARMNIGNFSRGGRNRVLTKAEDHDLGVTEKLTPFGFFLPEHDDLFLFFTLGYVSSDFIVDRLEEIRPVIHEKYGADILTINRHYTDLFQPADLTESRHFASDAKSIG